MSSSFYIQNISHQDENYIHSINLWFEQVVALLGIRAQQIVHILAINNDNNPKKNIGYVKLKDLPGIRSPPNTPFKKGKR